jgi:hypothetical protein
VEEWRTKREKGALMTVREAGAEAELIAREAGETASRSA